MHALPRGHGAAARPARGPRRRGHRRAVGGRAPRLALWPRAGRAALDTLRAPRLPRRPLVPDQPDFAILRSRSAAALTVRLTQPSPRGRAPRLERPRTPRAAASLGPRLARNLARHSAGSREVWGILVGDALAAVLGHDAAERLHEAVHVG